MRRDFIASLAKIDFCNPVGVETITLVRVDDYHEKTRVGMDHLSLVTGLQIPEDRSIIEEGQVDHVLTFLEFWWIDSSNLNSLVGKLFMAHSNHTLAPWVLKISRFNQTFTKASSLRIWNPHRLLGIIGLVLVSSFHIHRWEQKLRGVRIGCPRLSELDMARHVAAAVSPFLGLIESRFETAT
jgi:hypothetical protein